MEQSYYNNPYAFITLLVVMLAIIALALVVIAITLIAKNFGRPTAIAPPMMSQPYTPPQPQPQPKACPNCGKVNDANQVFCGSCGTKL